MTLLPSCLIWQDNDWPAVAGVRVKVCVCSTELYILLLSEHGCEGTPYRDGKLHQSTMKLAAAIILREGCGASYLAPLILRTSVSVARSARSTWSDQTQLPANRWRRASNGSYSSGSRRSAAALLPQYAAVGEVLQDRGAPSTKCHTLAAMLTPRRMAMSPVAALRVP